MTKDITLYKLNNLTGETTELGDEYVARRRSSKIPNKSFFTKVYNKSNIAIPALQKQLINISDLGVLLLLSEYMDYDNNCKTPVTHLPGYSKKFQHSIKRLKEANLITRAKHIGPGLFIHPLFSCKGKTTPKTIVDLFKKTTLTTYNIHIYKEMYSK